MTSCRSLALAFLLIGTGLLAFASQAYPCPSGMVCPPGKQCPPVENCVQPASEPQEDNSNSNNADALRRASQQRAKDMLENDNNQLNDDGGQVSTSPDLSGQINHLGSIVRDNLSSSVTTTATNICGPDVTRNVFDVLDKMHRDWKKWDGSKMAEKCRDLMNPLYYEEAWDIAQLSPDVAPLGEESYKEAFPNGDYQGYLDNNKFWFEWISDKCAKPRHYPCGPTVEFLGQCIHAQVVNYIQWGFINRLCDQRGFGKTAHAGRATLSGTPDSIYAGQQLMSQIGDAYAPNIANWPSHIFRSLNREEQKDEMEALMKRRLLTLMANPDYKDFGKRSEAICQKVCKLTEEEQKKLSAKFRYRWGSGGNSARR